MFHQREHPHSVPHITALPQPLLEKILISGTSTEDKEALRQTCKHFQHLLDDNLVCIRLRIDEDMEQERFMKRMQHSSAIRVVDLAATHNVSSLLGYLPSQLTMLKLGTRDIGVKELARLPQLTTLYLEGYGLELAKGMVTGIEYISGLTRLHCDKPIGSLAHLAPTLKFLSIWDYKFAQGLNKLTKLEVLRVADNVPANFFHANRRLRLQHLYLMDCGDTNALIESEKDWRKAPTTLTHLSLTSVLKPLPNRLPSGVTHLQITCVISEAVEQAVAALPGLRRLDLFVKYSWADWNSAFASLSQLKDLETLYVCMCTTLNDGYWPAWKVLQALPELDSEERRGVKVHIVESMEEWADVFEGGRQSTKTAWATLT